MLKADLQKHMEERGLELTDPKTEKDKTRERMIFEIQSFEENRAEMETEPSAFTLGTPRTSEKASGFAETSFPDAEGDWMFGDEPVSLSASASRQQGTQPSRPEERSARLFAEMEQMRNRFGQEEFDKLLRALIGQAAEGR